MKVLCIASTDSANVGFLLSQALNSIGVESRAVAIFPAPRPEGLSAEEMTKYQIAKIAVDYDVIQFMHSTWIDLKIDLKDKLISVFHGGYKYRNTPKETAAFWNKKAGLQLVQTGDLLGLGVENEEWFLPPVDTDLLYPIDSINEKLKVLHCPSKPIKKGTEPFRKVMLRLSKDKNLKGKFTWEIGSKVNWKKNIHRMSMCDIYFDACLLKIKGNPYGFWGMAALEAAALGKVVVTHFAHKEKEYIERYGMHYLQVANDMKQLRERMLYLLNNPEEVPRLQKETREWVVRNHSMSVVGNRLKELYEKYI